MTNHDQIQPKSDQNDRSDKHLGEKEFDKKIHDKYERARLKQIIKSIKPKKIYRIIAEKM